VDVLDNCEKFKLGSLAHECPKALPLFRRATVTLIDNSKQCLAWSIFIVHLKTLAKDRLSFGPLTIQVVLVAFLVKLRELGIYFAAQLLEIFV